LGDGRWLLILDNLEQVLDAAGDLGELLVRCPHVAILATSRTVLGLRAEHDYPVPPLSLADDPTVPVETLIASPAVALFVDRARAVHPASRSPRPTPRRWQRSAGAWRACRWPSSWPLPAPGC
jgi:predicted ATPase